MAKDVSRMHLRRTIFSLDEVLPTTTLWSLFTKKKHYDPLEKKIHMESLDGIWIMYTELQIDFKLEIHDKPEFHWIKQQIIFVLLFKGFFYLCKSIHGQAWNNIYGGLLETGYENWDIKVETSAEVWQRSIIGTRKHKCWWNEEQWRNKKGRKHVRPEKDTKQAQILNLSLSRQPNGQMWVPREALLKVKHTYIIWPLIKKNIYNMTIS